MRYIHIYISTLPTQNTTFIIIGILYMYLSLYIALFRIPSLYFYSVVSYNMKRIVNHPFTLNPPLNGNLLAIMTSSNKTLRPTTDRKYQKFFIRDLSAIGAMITHIRTYIYIYTNAYLIIYRCVGRYR